MAFFNPFKKKKNKEEVLRSEARTVEKEKRVSLKKTTQGKHEKALKPGSLRIDQAASGGEKKSFIIFRPRITEKASFITADGAYTFDVDPRANKIQIKEAIREIYGIKPRRVNIVQVPAKRISVRGKRGVRSGGRKAIVYLKEGEKIEFV